MDYLRLGSLVFSSGQSLTGFNEQSGFSFAQHDIATGKPSLQAMGENLSQITLNIRVATHLGHNVSEIINKIDELLSSGEPQIFVFANGTYQGDYVLTEKSVSVLKTNGKGDIIAADINISLLEYSLRVVIEYNNTEKRKSLDQINRQIRNK